MSQKSNFYSLYIPLPTRFDLGQTLNCGQCFRFKEDAEGKYCGVALDKYFEFKTENNLLCVYCDSPFCEKEIIDYFDFDRDYDKINTALSSDETMKKAIEYAGGIRVLRQPHWETLCSFILSQNNNIKRITGIIERLCENFGDTTKSGFFTFPSAEKIAQLSIDDLSPIRSGFRAKYIIDAAQKVVSGEINFNEIINSDYDTAHKILMKINGVGPKVADCVLLFGINKLEAFPKDVWIKKALLQFYPNGIPDIFNKYGGIAQQYLFHYIRTNLN